MRSGANAFFGNLLRANAARGTGAEEVVGKQATTPAPQDQAAAHGQRRTGLRRLRRAGGTDIQLSMSGRFLAAGLFLLTSYSPGDGR